MVPLSSLADAGAGSPVVATDRNLWAQVKLAKLCAKSGARLVHAAEVAVRWGADQVGHVVVLARSRDGWRALRWLCSLATPAACDLAQLSEAVAMAGGWTADRGKTAQAGAIAGQSVDGGLVVLTGGSAENGGLLHSAWRAGGWDAAGPPASRAWPFCHRFPAAVRP
jgi:hypothetical protein